MMRMAHERGIEVTAGIWDHIYRGGVQGGGIPGASENAGKRVPGLVWGVTAENLAAYTKAALAVFSKCFPRSTRIQFRMHDESGLKRTEMAGFWHDVFQSMKQARPNLRVDLRVKDLPDEVIDDALRQGLNARVNTKYWMEQMGLPFHPTHVQSSKPTRPPPRIRGSPPLSAALSRALAALERRNNAPAALGRSRLRAPLCGERAPV